MAISVAKAKKLVLQKGAKKTVVPVRGIGAKAKRAKLTKAQIAKRKLGKPINPKQKRAKLTKAQIAKRRAKGITSASVVGRPAVPVNRATVTKKVPARGTGKKTVRWV